MCRCRRRSVSAGVGKVVGGSIRAVKIGSAARRKARDETKNFNGVDSVEGKTGAEVAERPQRRSR